MLVPMASAAGPFDKKMQIVSRRVTANGISLRIETGEVQPERLPSLPIALSTGWSQP